MAQAKAAKKEAKFITMNLHNMSVPHGAHKKRKIKGRGSSSGHGKTSTRGSKGQTSRSGRGVYAGFEGGQSPLIRKMPKRGFTSARAVRYQVVNLERLEKLKVPAITPEVMYEKGLVESRNKPVKILGDGEIKTALNVSAHAFSKTAQEKITAAGGKAEVVNA